MSLWPVEDEAAREWMVALYTARFNEGATTVDAVRRAGSCRSPVPSHVQLHDVAVGKNVIALDRLAVEHGCPPNPGELEGLGNITVDE